MNKIALVTPLLLLALAGGLAPAQVPPTTLPREADLREVQASGPLHKTVEKSFARQLEGPFGSDWNNPNEPGDGRGRWMQALCNYGAYLHLKPEQMIQEMARMQKMRNPNGYFGLTQPPEVIQAQASFDNSWPIQWGIDYTRYFQEPFGEEFARGIADSFYVPRTAYLAPYANAPTGHWMGEYGHSGVGFGGMVAMARLAMVTGEERYAKFARALADLFLDENYERRHGHCTSTALLGLLFTYELTGDSRYLNGAIRGADSVLLRNEQPYLAFLSELGNFPSAYTEGCGVSDWFYLNLKLGRATGDRRYFDRAERIFWGPFLHHLRPNGGMGLDRLDRHGRLQVAAYEAAGCCTMWTANGLVRAFTHAVLADDERLTLPLYYSFTATSQLKGGKKVKLSMETSYPNQGAIQIRLLVSEPTFPWALRLRVPAWSRITSVKINGEIQMVTAENGWLTLPRTWRTGDEVSFLIPLPLWLSHPNSDEALTLPQAQAKVTLEKIRLFRGPLLLGIDKSRNPDLTWNQTNRFTLVLQHEGNQLVNLSTQDASTGFDPAFVCPSSHLKVDVLPGSPEAAPVQAAVLTPIGEGPGRLGPSKEAVQQVIQTNREAILFDAVLTKAGGKENNSQP